MTAAALGRPGLGLPFAGALVAGGAAVGLIGSRQPLMAVGLLVVAGTAGCILIWREHATVVFVFLIWMNIPVVAISQLGAPLLLAAVVPLLLVIPLVTHWMQGEAPRITPPFALMMVLLIAQILATLFSDHQILARDKLFTFAVEGVLVYFLITNAVRTPETLRRCIWAMVAAGALLATLTVWQKVTGTWSRSYGGFGTVQASFFAIEGAPPRASGPLGDPNYYAQMLLPLVPLGLITMWRERWLPLRLAAGGSTFLICAAIMITNSRGAALAFGVVLVAMAFLGQIKPSHLALLLLGLVMLLALVPEYRDRVATLGTVSEATSQAGSEGSDQSTQGRTTEMVAAALVFSDHPAVGVGPGVFPQYYQEYARRVGLQVHESVRAGKKKGQEAQRQSHNMLLSVAAELGALGLGAFLVLLYATARRLLQARKRWLSTRPELSDLASGMLLALIGYVSAGLFLTLAFERYFWLLMALAAATAALASDRGRRPAAGAGTSGTA